MAKHALIALFLFFFTHFSTAQLTLQRLSGKGKHVIPAGTLISMSFPMKTKGLPEEAAQIYTGRLKTVSETGVGVTLTYENRDFVNENGVIVQEKKDIHPLDSPMIVQIPITRVQCITHYYDKKRNLANAGFLLAGLAIVSNLFLAPQLDTPFDKKFRNGGYLLMGLGLLTALIPTHKTFYFEQPKKVKKKKTLWKLGN